MHSLAENDNNNNNIAINNRDNKVTNTLAQ